MLWECLECSTRYALDLQACPHCGSDHREEDMPKITRHGGASDARDIPVAADDDVVSVAPERSEQPSPGNSSSASPKRTASTSKKSAPNRQRPARTTVSRSSRDPEANSSAGGTATSGPETAD